MGVRVTKGVIGEMKGGIDTIVLSPWNDIDTIRGKPTKNRKKSKSPKLIAQKNLFGMVSSFLRPGKEIFKVGYQKARKVVLTTFDAAMSYHLKNAVVNDEEGVRMLMPKLKLTLPRRTTQPAWNPVLSMTDNKVTVRWQLNPFPQKCTQLDDKVSLVFYDKQRKIFLWREAGIRSDVVYMEDLSIGHAGHDIYCYIFLVSADGKLVSETEYLGMITITGKEETWLL